MLSQPDHRVRHFRDTLVWPLQITPGFAGEDAARIRRILGEKGSPWRPVKDEFTADPKAFQERHYKEFVSFLPYVQRFLYGEGRSARTAFDDPPAPASMEVFRRHDVGALRVTLGPDDNPILLKVAHVDLYLFADLDVALLNVEVHADDLPLDAALEILYRFGRAYPAGWDEAGRGLHNACRTEVLDANGGVLAASDGDDRGRYLRFVCQHRAPSVGTHWAFLLQPLVLDYGDDAGEVRFRQIEYYRMPMMAYLALDNPRALTRDDFIRIGLVAYNRPTDPLPKGDPSVAEFENRHCEDRYWTNTEAGPNTRFLCTGNAIVVVGEANSAYFCDADLGVLGQFRHQYFLLFLIAHFQRAALLSFSDSLSDAVSDLDAHTPDSVRRFKRRIRHGFETFLRFTHRYWFHEVSERGQVQALFRRTQTLLNNDKLFAHVKAQIREMSEYLDSDSQRRQSATVVRLTVITILGLIGTIVTGFFGMNLLALADRPLPERVTYFAVGSVVVVALVFFAVARSKRLSDFLEAMSDERLGLGAKLAFLGRVFVKPR